MYGIAGESSFLVTSIVGEGVWEVVVVAEIPGHGVWRRMRKRWIGALQVSARWLLSKRYEANEIVVIEVMFTELALCQVVGTSNVQKHERIACGCAMLLPELS